MVRLSTRASRYANDWRPIMTSPKRDTASSQPNWGQTIGDHWRLVVQETVRVPFMSEWRLQRNSYVPGARVTVKRTLWLAGMFSVPLVLLM